NGGSVQTQLPLVASPLLDAGSNPMGLSFDERGPGYARQIGAGVDIGAAEFDPSVPNGTAKCPNVTAPGATSYDISVTYSDDTGIDVSSLDSNDVRVTGPGGFNVLASFVSVDQPSNGTPRIATYQFTPPGGTWDAGDDGVYSVNLEPNQV